MAAAPANPVHANVACLRIPRFDSRSPGEQASLKEQLENRVLAATREVGAQLWMPGCFRFLSAMIRLIDSGT